MTISDTYLAQQKALHKNPNYGVASGVYAPLVAKVIDAHDISSIADYGAGKCVLRKKLNEMGKSHLAYFPYDPSFPEYGKPKEADLVCCIDVLEHIEPEYLSDVLAELHSIMGKAGFFTIHTGPAEKILADGRNAHLIQKPTSWWLPLLCERFEIVRLERVQGGVWVIVEPLAT